MKKLIITSLIFLFLSATNMYAQEKSFSSLQSQCKLIAPNAFTPNDDGVNDFFHLSFTGNCESLNFSLKIYDRWGRLVFEADEVTTEWDGTYDGQQLKEGVYLWQSSVTWDENQISAENKSESKKGTLVLIR